MASIVNIERLLKRHSNDVIGSDVISGGSDVSGGNDARSECDVNGKRSDLMGRGSIVSGGNDVCSECDVIGKGSDVKGRGGDVTGCDGDDIVEEELAEMERDNDDVTNL